MPLERQTIKGSKEKSIMRKLDKIYFGAENKPIYSLNYTDDANRL